MKNEKIHDVLVTPLKIISVPNGDVMHAMKLSDKGYKNFGEAYFSTIKTGVIKAWKKHQKMTLNLVVPQGKVKFVLYDDRKKSQSYGSFYEIILSPSSYFRLTVPPKLWLGFKGLHHSTSIILNVASIEHSSNEVEKKEIDKIFYDWELN
jgi:dTDP-4-dehydrorhamnose 3,5-epimerase